MKNCPFENLAQMCNITDAELNNVKANQHKRRRRIETSDITKTYNSAVRTFKSMSNVISIAHVRQTTSNNVINEYCRKTLGQHDASRVTELVIKAIS